MKTLKSLLILSLVLVVSGLQAQDKVYRKTGDVVAAKIIEVNDEFVVYKMFNNLEGPNYKLRKDAIDKVVYENGSTETFSGSTQFKPMNTAPARPAAPTMIANGEGSAGLGYNILNFDFLSILFNEVGFSYERILNNGYIGLKLPLIIGVNSSSDQTRDYSNLYQSGLDLNLYPTGQGSAKYFIGPSIRFGQVHGNNSYYSDGSYYGELDFNMLAFQVNNGVMFQPTPHFNVSLVFGVGLRKLTPTGREGDINSGNYAVFNANIAYRF